MKPALYSVHNASPTATKIAEVQIHPDRAHTVTPVRPLSLAERQSIAAFQP
jgi:hypothetical protein